METKPYVVYINAVDEKVHFIIIRQQRFVNLLHSQGNQRMCITILQITKSDAVRPSDKNLNRTKLEV